MLFKSSRFLPQSTYLAYVLFILVSVPGSSAQTLPQGLPIDTALAHRYLREVCTICDKDNGSLWNDQLYGPILLVEPKSRMVVSNQADSENNLTGAGEICVGKLPNEINVANTALTWAGVKWSMIIWPLPENRFARTSLMIHELWHRIQDEIGFPSPLNPTNNHLDSREGRIWLQLEWRALREALMHHGDEHREAITDALLFRSYRRKLFLNATTSERALEMHEGLAEYTGIELSGGSEAERTSYAANKLEEAPKSESFVRSFAYASGPAYGILLDESRPGWIRMLKPKDDLGVLLQESLPIELPMDIQKEAPERSKKYDGEALRNFEVERERIRGERSAKYRARLVDGPILVIPLQSMSMSFDPHNLLPLDTLGTVYPTIRISDLWGILTVSNGALMNPNFTRINVPAPSDPNLRPLHGDKWTLELNEGFTVRPSERKGDYIVGKSN